jgi:O-antigen/teichoic acid export membrane protein
VSVTRRNLAASIAGRFWGLISFYLFIPIYLHLLGAEAYGVVGFYAVLSSVLLVADVGLTSTLSREMARLSALAGPGGGESPDAATAGDDRRDLARTLETLYVGVALLVGVGVVVLAPFIADHWLQARTLPRAELLAALRMMGIALALQLTGSFYSGGLVGLERLVAANALQVGWGVLRSGGAALVLWRVSPTLHAFFLAMIAANVVYVIVVRATFWRLIGAGRRARFRIDLLARTGRYAAAMAAWAAVSVLLTQLDRLAVSRLLPLETFAHYSLASTLAQVPTIVSAAIAVALFPRLTALAATGPPETLRGFYHAGCQLGAVAILPLGLTLAAFSSEVLLFWTRSPATAAAAGTAGTLLLVGSTVFAMQMIPGQLALAYGWAGIHLRIGIVSVAVMAPALWVLVERFGLLGASSAWLGLNLVTLPVLVIWLHRRVMPGATRRWLFNDVGLPLLATLLVLAVARVLVPRTAAPMIGFLGALAAGGVALVAAALVSPAGRTWLRERGRSPMLGA